jgi:hypothetical protein
MKVMCEVAAPSERVTMQVEEKTGRWTRSAILLGTLAMCAPACRTLGPAEVNEDTRGTLAGVVRGPEGIAPVKGRLVEAVEVDTRERLGTRTNAEGGWSLLVPPGRYRIEVTLAPGETVVKDPGVVEVGPSQLVPHADVELGGAGVVDEE